MGKEIYSETFRVLIDIAAKDMVMFAKLIIDPAGPFVVVERSCDGAPCGSKFNRLPQHIHVVGVPKVRLPLEMLAGQWRPAR